MIDNLKKQKVVISIRIGNEDYSMSFTEKIECDNEDLKRQVEEACAKIQNKIDEYYPTSLE